MLKISLIISVYTKKEELALIYRMLEQQSEKDFEVIIADDDSPNNLKSFVEKLCSRYNIRTKFETHEFSGFGKNRILNKAIQASKSKYLVFIDGDCLPHKHFIKEHLKASAENIVLCGRRVMLGEKLSDKIKSDPSMLKAGTLKYLTLVKDKINTKNPSNYAEESIYINNKLLSKFIKKKITLVGCNFSLSKALMERINGFDEEYIGPGFGEDSDIEFRLSLAGAQFKSVRHKAILYHLYHPLTTVSNTNFKYFNEIVKKGNSYRCDKGLKTKKSVY